MKQYEAFIQYGNAQNLPMRTIKAEAVIVSPLWYHKRGLMQTASGYGKKLVTEYKIKYNNRFYRVYCCIFSNIGTLYIISKKHHINVELDHE